MAQRNIDFGSFPDDPNADAIRTAFQKVQENFSELFSGLQEQAVISVNRTAGSGVTVNSPTGNVIVSANIAQVRIQSTTLDLSTGSNASPASLAVINSGTVPIFINIPQNVTGIANITLSSTLTAPNVNVTTQLNGSEASFTGNIVSSANVTANGLTANTLSIATSANLIGVLSVTGNANISSNVTAGNITSNNALAANSLSIAGNANANIVNANYFYGDGSNITNVSAIANTRILNGTSYANISNVDGNLNIVITGNPTMTVTATGANITGALAVTGNVSAGNLVGRLANGGTSNITIVSATGNVTTAVAGTTRITATSTGANVTGTLGVSGNANVGNLGTAQILATANITAPQLISNVATGTAPFIVTSTTQVANLNVATAGTAGSATTAGTVTTAAQPNITSVGTLSSLAVTGNVTAGNVYANSGTIGATLLTGTLTTAAQPNVTSVGTLTNLGVSGNITAANITANTGAFTGNGSGLSALNASNLSTGTVPSARLTGSYSISVTSATTAGTVTTNAQPNITSVGTLSSLAVTGNVTAANFVGALANGNSDVNIPAANGNINFDVAGNANVVVMTGTGINVAGTLNATGNANVLNLGTGRVIATGNISGTQLISNITTGTAPLVVSSTTQVANLNAATAGTAGTVTANAQPNITSVGTLTSLSVTGNVTAGNFVGNLANGNSDVNIPAANGNINFDVAGNANVVVMTGTGVNVAGTLNATGNANLGNLGTARVIATANVTAPQLISNVATGTAPLVVSSTTQVANLNAATAGSATTAGTVTTNAQPNITSVGTLSSLAVTGNVTAGNVYANSGTIGASLLTGTLTTAAQPNITSVGTLSSLTVSGNLSSGNANLGNAARANFFIGDGSLLTNIAVGAGSFIENGNSEVRVDANSNVRISVSGNANVVTVTGTGANIVGTANITGNLSAGNISATTLSGNIISPVQTGITSLGTLTSLTVNGVSNLGPNSNVIITGGANNAFLKTDGAGNLIWDTATLVPAQGANTQVIFNDGGNIYAGSTNFTFNKTSNVLTIAGNVVAGNISGANNIISNFFTGTLRTNAQPNITSVGTLTSLNVNNSVTAVSFTANTGIFTGNGSGLSALNASNISTGTLSSDRLTGTYNISVTGSAASATTATTATTAGTVTTAAQPNITSVGTLSTLLVSGNVSAANITVASGTITANLFSGNGASLTNLNGSNVTGTVANATAANALLTNTSSATTVYPTFVTSSSNGWSSSLINTGISANLSNGSITATTFVGSLSGTATSATSATTAGTVTTNAQPNITSVGTLTSLAVTGNANVGNIGAVAAVFTGTLNVSSTVSFGGATFNHTGTTSNITGSAGNVTATFAGGITGSGNTKTVNIGTSGAAGSTTTITIGSVNGTDTTINGTLTVTGNAAAGNISATNGVFTNVSGNGSALTALNASNITTGTLAQARLANSSLTVNGTSISLGGSATITANTTQTLTLGSYLTGTSFNGGTAVTANVDATTTSTANKVVARDTNANIYANNAIFTAVSGNGAGLSAIAGANVTGTVASATSATTASTVTTAAQPNITSVGTLTSLAVTGNISGGNISTSNYITAGTINPVGNGKVSVTSNVDPGTTPSALFVKLEGASGGTATAQYGIKIDANQTYNNSTAVYGVYSTAKHNTGKTSVGVHGQVGVLSSYSPGYGIYGQADFSSDAVHNYANGGLPVGVYGTTLNSTGTGNVATSAAGYFYNQSTSAATAYGVIIKTTSGPTNVIPLKIDNDTTELMRVTSVGNVGIANNNPTHTLSVTGTMNVSGNANVGNIGATNGVFTNVSGNGVGLSAIVGANVVGNVSSAVTAGTVTTAAQPNITSVGTLTSLTSSGNVSAANVNVTGYHIRSVNTGLAAAGNNQATALGLFKEINLVNTVPAGSGVRLPTAVAGMAITIINTTANTVLVYPHSGGDINGAATNAAFSHSAGATLQYVAPNTTDWYTVGATFA